MDSTPETFGDKFARVVRVSLIAGIAVVAALWVTTPRLQDQFALKSAHAEGGIAAAPGYLALTVNMGAKFHLLDTKRQVICVYDIDGDKLRLVSARKFDHDARIFDGSIGGGRFPRGIEGGNGVNRREADEYAKMIESKKEEAEKKNRK